MGRPSKFSLGLARRVAAQIAKGMRIKDAAEACGAEYKSIRNYCDQSDAFNSIIVEALAKGKRPKQTG